MRELKKILPAFRKLARSLHQVGTQIQRSIHHTFSPQRGNTDQGYDQPLVTLPYPHKNLPVPNRGRYQLDNQIADCIGCDKCARVCPVDCIEIEGIPAPELIGLTRNGMKKRIHLAKFNIDLAKCCFCGLCTTVCPTQCLTMTPTYDFSVFDLAEHTFSFATMTESEILDKKAIWQRHQHSQAAPTAPPAILEGEPMGITTFYYIGIGLAGLGGLFLWQSRKELPAILGFLWITVGLSMVFFLQGASFIAAMQIAIQGGSALVWLLTSLWFKQTPQQPISRAPRILRWVFLGVIGIGIAGLGYYGARHMTSLGGNAFTHHLADISTVGRELLGTQGIAFEWTGLIVLLALVLVVDCITNLKK